jgi:hypothetical protein
LIGTLAPHARSITPTAASKTTAKAQRMIDPWKLAFD